MSEEDKRLTAYHEGGHALVALYTKHALPLYKATILPRGQALGVTHFLPENDMLSQTKAQLMSSLDVAMGGRVAEELIFGADMVTTGASSDLSSATGIARRMVTQYGMSESSGAGGGGGRGRAECGEEAEAGRGGGRAAEGVVRAGDGHPADAHPPPALHRGGAAAARDADGGGDAGAADGEGAHRRWGGEAAQGGGEEGGHGAPQDHEGARRRHQEAGQEAGRRGRAGSRDRGSVADVRMG